MKKFVIKRLVVLGVLFVLFVGGKWFVAEKHWQAFDFDRQWCEETAAQAEPIREALERYRIDKGEYPVALSMLVPMYLPTIPEPIPHPTGRGDNSWRYRRISSGEYQIMVTTMHWVSSFDVFVVRSSGNYPGEWRRFLKYFKVGEWRYLIGGSSAPGLRQR